MKYRFFKIVEIYILTKNFNKNNLIVYFFKAAIGALNNEMEKAEL
jgi:hypothetical protein